MTNKNKSIGLHIDSKDEDEDEDEDKIFGPYFAIFLVNILGNAGQKYI